MRLRGTVPRPLTGKKNPGGTVPPTLTAKNDLTERFPPFFSGNMTVKAGPEKAAERQIFTAAGRAGKSRRGPDRAITMSPTKVDMVYDDFTISDFPSNSLVPNSGRMPPESAQLRTRSMRHAICVRILLFCFAAAGLFAVEKPK